LGVPKLSQLTKKLSTRPLHLFPGRVRIYRHETVGQGTAAAQGDPEVMDGIRGKLDGDPVTLLENPVHPESEAVLLDGGPSSGNGGSGHRNRIPLYGRKGVFREASSPTVLRI
jgi:hypothetical protein